MSDCVAVFDVGKTNKKLIVYDAAMRQVAEAIREFPADETGAEHVEQTGAAAAWLLDQLAILAAAHPIAAIGISTHGATMACIDAAGELALPTVAYTTDPGEAFQRRFEERLGGDGRSLHREFATPPLGGLVNAARQLVYIQEHHPEAWAATRWALPYPQYFGHLLTGQIAAEPTMLGCHSYLYDFATGGYSRAVDALELRDRMPPTIGDSGSVLGTISAAIAARTGLRPDTRVILGVHDSNASLIPYLMLASGRFMLNSTGTWCVCMRPDDSVDLTDAQLDLGVFYNCSAFGQPVKTAIFMGGQERQVWLQALARRHAEPTVPDFDPAVHAAVLAAADAFIMPGAMPGTGPFPRSRSRLVHAAGETPLAAVGPATPGLGDPAHDHALLDISLAVQTAEMLHQLEPEPGMQVFIEGGFRHNPGYQAVLAALCPEQTVVLSDLEQATAFGTGLLATAALREVPLGELAGEVTVATRPAATAELPGLTAYRERFLQHARH